MPPQATSGSITKACAYCSSIESDSRRSANQPKKPIAAHNVENSGIRARIGFRFSRLKDNKSGAISSTPPESPSHQRNHAGANAAQGIWPVRTRLKAPPLAVTVMPTTAANANAGPSLPRLKSGIDPRQAFAGTFHVNDGVLAPQSAVVFSSVPGEEIEALVET